MPNSDNAAAGDNLQCSLGVNWRSAYLHGQLFGKINSITMSWLIFAFLSAITAALVAIFGKMGLKGLECYNKHYEGLCNKRRKGIA